MSKTKDYIVIGLGRFGLSVVNTLLAAGQSVIALDIDEDKINKVSDKVAFAAKIDATDEVALEEVGVKHANHVVVAMGSDFESSVMCIIALKALGVKNITVKSNNDRQAIILNQIGIDNIVSPEIDTGKRVAMRIMHKAINDFINLDSEHSIIQIEVKNNEYTDISIAKMNLRDKYAINIIAIKREGRVIIPRADAVLKVHDILIIICNNSIINKIEQLFAEKV